MAQQVASRYGRQDLANGLMHLEGLSEARANRIVQLMIQQIVLALMDGKSVYLPSLGKLYPVYCNARQGIHPRTLEKMIIKPSVRIRFEQSSSLRRELRAHVDRLHAQLSPEELEAEYSLDYQGTELERDIPEMEEDGGMEMEMEMEMESELELEMVDGGMSLDD